MLKNNNPSYSDAIAWRALYKGKYIFSVKKTNQICYQGKCNEHQGKLVKHTLIANTAYNKETAEAELKKGIAKVISFGSLFLANPDLPKRFELNSPLNQPDRMTMFGGIEKGYTDYPFLVA